MARHVVLEISPDGQGSREIYPGDVKITGSNVWELFTGDGVTPKRGKKVIPGFSNPDNLSWAKSIIYCARAMEVNDSNYILRLMFLGESIYKTTHGKSRVKKWSESNLINCIKGACYYSNGEIPLFDKTIISSMVKQGFLNKSRESGENYYSLSVVGRVKAGEAVESHMSDKEWIGLLDDSGEINLFLLEGEKPDRVITPEEQERLDERNRRIWAEVDEKIRIEREANTPVSAESPDNVAGTCETDAVNPVMADADTSAEAEHAAGYSRVDTPHEKPECHFGMTIEQMKSTKGRKQWSYLYRMENPEATDRDISLVYRSLTDRSITGRTIGRDVQDYCNAHKNLPKPTRSRGRRPKKKEVSQ